MVPKFDGEPLILDGLGSVQVGRSKHQNQYMIRVSHGDRNASAVRLWIILDYIRLEFMTGVNGKRMWILEMWKEDGRGEAEERGQRRRERRREWEEGREENAERRERGKGRDEKREKERERKCVCV